MSLDQGWHSIALKRLEIAVHEFELSCAKLSKKNRKLIRVRAEDLQKILPKGANEVDVRQAGQIFGSAFTDLWQEKEDQMKKSANTWTYKVGAFMGKLYPLAMFSLHLTSAISEVQFGHT